MASGFRVKHLQYFAGTPSAGQPDVLTRCEVSQPFAHLRQIGERLRSRRYAGMHST